MPSRSRTSAACVFVLLLCSAANAQIPEQDIRNTNTPETNTHFAMAHYMTLAQWETRKAHLRQQILAAAGLFPLLDRTPLHPKIFGHIERNGYSIEKVLLETLPGYYLGGNLFRPNGRSGKFPAILKAHGHWAYGRLQNDEVASNPSFGINMARQGYVVFAWDMVGYNDTIQTPHAFGNAVEQLWSFTPLGLQLWNSMRVLDFVSSLDDVDPARVGMAGASGGGTQTFLLAAVDDRLQYAAPSNMVSFIMQGGDTCENSPGLRLGTNNVEIAAMFAPKPMLMMAATGDWTRNMLKEELPAIREIYKLYGKPENVQSFMLDAPHNFNKQNRESVYRFFGKQILNKPDGTSFEEKNTRIEMLQDMLALEGRTLNENALPYDQIFAEWKDMAVRQRQTAKPVELKRRLQAVLAVEWPDKVLSKKNGESIVLGRPGVGDRVPGMWFPGHGESVLVVHPEGAQAALKNAAVQDLRKTGRPVL
ncbi:MAG TPA: acetylxylan esterase, partial [Bryobacteraceae bacterium]|nr:acetylxylan esterase [Bryobacteraceae bacterium]